MLKKRFREYFTYTKRERNGIIVLLLLLLVLLILRIYQTNKSYGEIAIMDEEFKKEIEAFEKSLVFKEKKKVTYRKAEVTTDAPIDDWRIPNELFNFNPNKISEAGLNKLGFSKKQINTLIKYREKGGKFYKKEDLLKIYGISEDQYKVLEPNIVIEMDLGEEDNLIVEKEVLKIEVNTATIDELIKLNGIGDVFANRIVKYRNKLGGFYKKDQLLEVYGLDSVRFKGIKDNILIDSSTINKISLNGSGYKDFINHPYLNKYQTQAILKYREVVGNFDQIEQVYLNKLLPKEEYLKLKPYLKLN